MEGLGIHKEEFSFLPSDYKQEAVPSLEVWNLDPNQPSAVTITPVLKGFQSCDSC